MSFIGHKLFRYKENDLCLWETFWEMKNLSFEYDRRKGRFAGEKFRVLGFKFLVADYEFSEIINI